MAGRNTSKTLFICLFALALSAMVALAPLPCFTQTALADVGGFAGDTDYGGGNDNDYGGGNDDWGNDWGNDNWDDNDDWDWGGTTTWDNDDDDRWSDGTGGNSNSNGYDIEFSDTESVVVGAVVLVVVFVIGLVGITKLMSGRRRSSSRQRKTVQSTRPEGAARTADSKLRPLSELQERDPGFSADDVEELFANVYVRMQNAWTAGDFEPMRPYFSNTLFAQLASQLGALRAKGKTNYVDNISVLETRIRGWFESHDQEHLTMKVRTRITDYTVDNATGNVVGGFKDSESFMEYEYDLVRPAGTKTAGQHGQTVVGECPNCGAPIDLAQSARCEYCGSVIESAQHTWVIDKIKGISQQIAH